MRAWGRFAAGALALLGAGCDDATIITHVDAGQARLARSMLVTAGAAGFPVEIHGAPFAGVTAGEVAARLRPPGGFPTGIRFRPVAPGAEARRLVLVFNRDGHPDAYADCRIADAPRSRPPQAQGFTVSATICSGQGMVVTGHLQARGVRADDPDAFARAMTLLLRSLTEPS